MPADGAPAHLPALGSHQREQVGHELQTTLVELIDLSLLGKQLHWSVVGPHSRSVHLQLDELVDRWRELADSVAERAVTVGFWPDGQAGAVAAGTSHVALERGAITDHVAVRELTLLLAATSERLRERMDSLGEIDLASRDLLVGVTRQLEQQLWMLRTQLIAE